MQIYIHRDGQQYGPYSVEQAREHLAAGELLPDDLAWHEGAAEWLPLHGVLEAAATPDEPVIGHEPTFEHEPAFEEEPQPEPQPEPAPAPAPARSAEPSWVPPRRDGMQSPTPFPQPARLPVPSRAPAASSFAPALASTAASAPVSTPPAAAPARAVAASPTMSDAQAQAFARRQVASRAPSGSGQSGHLRSAIIGGVICLVGVAITIGTYEEAASSPHGGSYTVAWGAILFGGIRCVTALVRHFGD